jgi:Tfp pilus assembly protein PilF
VLELNARLFPRSSSAHAALADAFAAAGDPARARQHFEKALVIDPKNEAAQKARAKLRE